MLDPNGCSFVGPILSDLALRVHPECDMISKIDEFFEKLGRLWCAFAHNSVMWPINGHYRCRTCLRLYPVSWEQRAVPLRAAVTVPIDIAARKKAA